MREVQYVIGMASHNNNNNDRPIYVPKRRRQQQRQNENQQQQQQRPEHDHKKLSKEKISTDESNTLLGQETASKKTRATTSVQCNRNDGLNFIGNDNCSPTGTDMADDSFIKSEKKESSFSNIWKPPTLSSSSLSLMSAGNIDGDKREISDKIIDDFHSIEDAMLELSDGFESSNKRVQRLEDYMDDRDYNEWGGPLRVRHEYNTSSASTANKTTNNNNSRVDDSSTIAEKVLWNVAVKVKGQSMNIGERLLRNMGWKGNDVAYAKMDDFSHSTNKNVTIDDDSNEDDMVPSFLAIRNLKKVHMKLQNIQIPVPKLDTNGLGYSPYLNAPEFEEFKKQRLRKRLLHQNSQFGEGEEDSGSFNRPQKKNVYRVSNVIDVSGTNDEDDYNDDDETDQSNENKHNATKRKNTRNAHEPESINSSSNMIVYPESIEDFIGSKSVSGFALHDDDDDAYDDDDSSALHIGDRRTIFSSIQRNTTALSTSSALTVLSTNKDEPKKNKTKSIRKLVNSETHSVLAYEHNDSDPEDNAPIGREETTSMHSINNTSRSTRTSGINFDTILSSWATIPSTNTALMLNETIDGTDSSLKVDNPGRSVVAVTSNGRPPLLGFVLGSSTNWNANPERFRGPDIPHGYEVEFHRFKSNEYPTTVYELSLHLNPKRREKMNTGRTNSIENTATASRNTNSIDTMINSFDHTTRSTSTIVRLVSEVQSQMQSELQHQQKQQEGYRPLLRKTNAFVGIAESMKNRFISSSPSSSGQATTSHTNYDIKSTTAPSIVPVGIALHMKTETKDVDITLRKSTASSTTESDVVMKRTSAYFVPKPLVCKRFHVQFTNNANVSNLLRTNLNEQAYYQDEIMKRAVEAGTVSSTKSGTTDERIMNCDVDKSSDNKIENDLYKLRARQILQELLSDTEYGAYAASSGGNEEDRPSIMVYKSIFEPQQLALIPQKELKPPNEQKKMVHSVTEMMIDTLPIATYTEINKTDIVSKDDLIMEAVADNRQSLLCELELSKRSGRRPYKEQAIAHSLGRRRPSQNSDSNHTPIRSSREVDDVVQTIRSNSTSCSSTSCSSYDRARKSSREQARFSSSDRVHRKEKKKKKAKKKKNKKTKKSHKHTES